MENLRTVGITGASGALGKELTKLFRKRGYKVIGFTHSNNNGQINDESPNEWIKWECGKEFKLKKHLKKIDILILNHGIYIVNSQNLNFENSLKINALSNFIDPNEIDIKNFPFVTSKNLTLNLSGGKKVDVWAARISYVGESGWEIYFNNDKDDGLALYDSLLEVGVVPVGIETYANSRRLEKSFRLQGADLETEYTAIEAAIQRPLVKEADFHGKAAHLSHRENEPCAILCTMTLDDLNVSGVPRYPVGISPIIDPATGEVPIDSKGRRS